MAGFLNLLGALALIACLKLPNELLSPLWNIKGTEVFVICKL
jgi:hypothetical protein